MSFSKICLYSPIGARVEVSWTYYDNLCPPSSPFWWIITLTRWSGGTFIVLSWYIMNQRCKRHLFRAVPAVMSRHVPLLFCISSPSSDLFLLLLLSNFTFILLHRYLTHLHRCRPTGSPLSSTSLPPPISLLPSALKRWKLNKPKWVQCGNPTWAREAFAVIN